MTPRFRLSIVSVGVLTLALAGALLPVPGAAAPHGPNYHSVCPTAQVGFARCHSLLRDAAAPATVGAPSGYGPADLWSAYALSPSGTTAAPAGGFGATVAIVDAYDDPTAEADLAVYRSQYGLPPCTTANGCFSKVSQTGGTRYPKANGGWAQEISLDLDMASAICPNCRLLLVEAASNSYLNLGTAVNTAAARGAIAISNSYGGTEFSGEGSYDGYYTHPGSAITVSSGDAGYGTEYPAASPSVTAVGGTRLSRDLTNSRGWGETAWSGAGSGCSAYETKPGWQAGTACGTKRAVADVSAIADPNTGVAVYDSYSYQGRSGWMVFGGTSVASPIIASVFALAGANTTGFPALPYSAPATSLNDVTAGSNGSCGAVGSPTYPLCNAGPSWDGPSGLGTPHGTGAF